MVVAQHDILLSLGKKIHIYQSRYLLSLGRKVASTTTRTMADLSSSQRPSPRRFIYNDEDLQHFLSSPSKRALLQFTTAMGHACASSSFQYDPTDPLLGLSPALACLHGALGALIDWIRIDFPADTLKPQRFGNPIFREWHTQLTQRSVAIVSAILDTSEQHQNLSDPLTEYEMDVLVQASKLGVQTASNSSAVTLNEKSQCFQDTVQELICYLQDAFGHPIRLDYGTGHETSFQIFLWALCKLNCFGSTAQQPPSAERLAAVTLAIYHQYLNVTRKLQTDYMLEPAGSHGVWGLDDHYCLPFYFGACQMQNQDDDMYTPKSIHDDSLLREKGDVWLYFGCIRFIKALKRGVPFFESSPMLNDISQLPSWSKVASGLLKLYEGEVLSKRQVVQHLVFGDICFPANWSPSQQEPLSAPTETFRTSHSRMPPYDPTVGERAPWAK
jgi:serine/threonine-protein phosphatase 2A activator